MSRKITIHLSDDVDSREYARVANLVWAVATSWDEVTAVEVDADHQLCDEVYDEEYCEQPSRWTGGKSRRTEGG